MKKINNNKSKLLRIDLDIKTKKIAIDFLKKRIAYLNDSGYLNKDRIDKIILIFKTSYSCKIVLKKEVTYNFIFNTESILGSDYKKQVCSMINYYKHKMYYPNRLFDVKRYPGGEFKFGKEIDVTKIIIDYVDGDEREKYHQN